MEAISHNPLKMDQDSLFSHQESIEELLASGISVEELLAAAVLDDEAQVEIDPKQQEMAGCQVRQIAFTPTHMTSF